MTRRPHGRLSQETAVLCALSLGTALSGCILQDKDIEIRDEKITNRNPVRFAEPIALSEPAETACDPNSEDMKLVLCPQPPADPTRALPHFLDPNYTRIQDDTPERPYYFCRCAEGEIDDRALRYTLYVEDQDEKSKSRDPADKIFAAFLLDLPPGSDARGSFTDYPNNLDNQTPLDPVEDQYKPLYRRDPHLRQLPVGTDDNPLDLCNGGRTRLSVGPHSLTVIVTDREWFSNPAEDVPIQIGTPDIASGATFDTITYVFFCGDGAASDPNCKCVNEDAVEGGL